MKFIITIETLILNNGYDIRGKSWSRSENYLVKARLFIFVQPAYSELNSVIKDILQSLAQIEIPYKTEALLW